MLLFSICEFLDVSTIITPCAKQCSLHSATNFGGNLNDSHEAFSHIKEVNLCTCGVIHSSGYKNYRMPVCTRTRGKIHLM